MTIRDRFLIAVRLVRRGVAAADVLGLAQFTPEAERTLSKLYPELFRIDLARNPQPGHTNVQDCRER